MKIFLKDWKSGSPSTIFTFRVPIEFVASFIDQAVHQINLCLYQLELNLGAVFANLKFHKSVFLILMNNVLLHCCTTRCSSRGSRCSSDTLPAPLRTQFHFGECPPCASIEGSEPRAILLTVRGQSSNWFLSNYQLVLAKLSSSCSRFDWGPFRPTSQIFPSRISLTSQSDYCNVIKAFVHLQFQQLGAGVLESS